MPSHLSNRVHREKQYKTRLARWKVGKYNHVSFFREFDILIAHFYKGRELLHVVRKARQAEISGRSVIFRVRGKEITVDDASRRLSRKCMGKSIASGDHLPKSPTPSIVSIQEVTQPEQHVSFMPRSIDLGSGTPTNAICSSQRVLNGEVFFDDSDPTWPLERDYPDWLECNVPAWLEYALNETQASVLEPLDNTAQSLIGDQYRWYMEEASNTTHTSATTNAKKRSKRAITRRRTKTGCLTCRLRRVKCDEAKPTCRNCEKSRRQCAGYQQVLTTSSYSCHNVRFYNSNVLTLSSTGPQDGWMFLRAVLPLPQRLNVPSTVQVRRMETALFILQRIVQLHFASENEEREFMLGCLNDSPAALKAIRRVIMPLAASIKKRYREHDYPFFDRLYDTMLG